MSAILKIYMKNPIVINFKRPKNQFIELNLEDLYYQNDHKRLKNMTVIKRKFLDVPISCNMKMILAGPGSTFSLEIGI